MGDRSAIEWTDATWNPIRARNLATGRLGWHCAHVSEGCRNCYAEGFNLRLGTQVAYKPAVVGKDVEIVLDEVMLGQPLRWTKPRFIFVGSMTDLFADFVTDGMLDRIFAIMALTPQHTYQLVTKRPERMRAFLSDPAMPRRVGVIMDALSDEETEGWFAPRSDGKRGWIEMVHPLPNVWLGTSAEDQATHDARWPELAACPAALRFFSFEPLLGPIDAVAAFATGLFKWAIVGGESGPKARPMFKGWVLDLLDQCHADAVAFLFKQWGGWTPGENVARTRGVVRTATLGDDGDWRFDEEDLARADGHADDEPDLYRVGKAAAGRRLDGVVHDALPDVR